MAGGGLGMGLELRVRPELRALPGLLHVLQAIGLGHDAVAEQVATALADNPMLRRVPGGACPGCGRHHPSGLCPRCAATARLTTEPAVRPFDTLAVAAGCEIRSAARPALPIVLAHLTARGLLDCEPGEIVARHGIPASAVAEALRAIKVAGPAGIGARTVRDMLLAQAGELVDSGAPALLADVVRDHLDAVAADDPAPVAAALAVPVAVVRELFGLVRTRLRPAATDDREPVARQVPDVLVYRDRLGRLVVEVADSRWFGVRVAAVPAAVRRDAAAVAWLAARRRAAKDFLRGLDVRASVLRDVATVAVIRQAGFFDRGPAGHVPLSRVDVAAALGLHPSTVSRAVAVKVLRCPDGSLIPFADLFGGAVAVKARIVALTAGRRLSDTELCAALNTAGFAVARRTVAKYRAQLAIPAGGRGRS